MPPSQLYPPSQGLWILLQCTRVESVSQRECTHLQKGETKTRASHQKKIRSTIIIWLCFITDGGWGRGACWGGSVTVVTGYTVVKNNFFTRQICSVRVLFYAVDVLLSRKAGSYMCKKSAKTDKAKIREILEPHLLQRGPNRVKSYSSLSGLIIWDFWRSYLQLLKAS